MGFLLTRVEVCICVLVHFLVLQNIVRDLGPNSWLNVHPLQGDHGARGLYCWGEPQPVGVTGKVEFFCQPPVLSGPQGSVHVSRLKVWVSVWFQTPIQPTSNPLHILRQLISPLSASVSLFIMGIRRATFQDRCGTQENNPSAQYVLTEN